MFVNQDVVRQTEKRNRRQGYRSSRRRRELDLNRLEFAHSPGLEQLRADIEEKFVDALAARLKLAPPTSSETVTSTSSDSTKQSSTTTSTTSDNGTTKTVSTGTGTTDAAAGRSSSASEGPGSTATLTFAPP